MSVPGERAEQLLRQVPLLAGLGDDGRDRLASRSEPVGLRAGRTLFEEGDPGDSLYLVCSGCLEAVSSTGVVIRKLRRGDRAGELALLTGAPRSASVRARRDSLLLRVSREDFEELLRGPSVAVNLLRGLGEQLRGSREAAGEVDAVPAVVAVTAAGKEISARDLADGLAARWRDWSTVAVLDGELAERGMDGETERARYAQQLDQSERANDRVLLVVEEISGRDEWAAFCLAQADRVLVATDCHAHPPPAPIPNCDLLVVGDQLAGDATSRWLRSLKPRATYRVPSADPGLSRGLDRLARRLSGRSVGVVLSGGGARGFAHIGAIGALEESGLEIDRVGGCSMGALVGALYACGRSSAEIAAVCRRELADGKPMSDYTLPVAGLIRGRRAEEMLIRMFGRRQIEELEIGYFCVSADLVAGELVVHADGPLYRAVGASSCRPGISPPVPEGGRLLVDGGILNNLPVETMAASGEGPTVAVDVTARYERRSAVAARPRARRLQAWFRRTVIGEELPMPSLRETLFRTIVLGSLDTAEVAQRHADLVIEPQVGEYGLTDFGQLERIVEAGRAAAESVLEDAHDWPPGDGAGKNASGPAVRG